MPDTDRCFDVLRAIGDLGLRQAATSALTAGVQVALEWEIERERAGTTGNAVPLRAGRRWFAFVSRSPLQRIAAVTPHVMTAALVALTVVVAVGAILLLGNRNHSQVAAGSITSQHQLLQTLGILRTRPTAVDRGVIACAESFAKHPSDAKCLRAIPAAVRVAERPDFAVAQLMRHHRSHPAHAAPSIRRYLALLGHPSSDLPLIRIVPLRGLAVSVGLFPGTWESSPRSAQRTAGILATPVFHDRADPFFQRASVVTLRAHGLALPIFVASPKHPGNNQAAIVVPDGVARITIGMVSMDGLSSVHWMANVSGSVHDNVATVQLNAPTFHTSGFGSIGPHATGIRLTWFDARGQIIRRTTTTIQLYIDFQRVGPPPSGAP